MLKTILSGCLALILSHSLSQFQSYQPPIGNVDMTSQNQSESYSKTHSPYFMIKAEEGIENFPLLSTSAEVNIAGVIADVKITQIYVNRGKKAIEAIYVFPMSTKAAVYDMVMYIGKKVVKAKIDQKEEAQQSYEQAKSQGKTASLLEQERPNVFQMNVANILPNDTIKIEIKYTEILIPENGLYSFVFPTVVGPRYSSPINKSAENESFVETPYQRENELPSYDFDLRLNLSSPVPISSLQCNSHKINKVKIDDHNFEITLDPSDKKKGNKDFILTYSLRDKKIQTGLMLSEIDNEKYFLLILQPPERVNKEEIPKREYIFVVDVSGSMYGFPLEVSKTLVKRMLSGLKPGEKFNIIFFSGDSKVLFPELREASKENIKMADSMLAMARAGGGTELIEALKTAYSFKINPEASRSIMVITDGYVSCEKEAFDLIRENLGNTNLFTFGIGSSVNRFLIEGMSRIGIGESFIVTNALESAPIADKFFEYVSSPLLTNIAVEYNGFDAYEQEPRFIPDLFANRPIIICGKWKNKASGEIIVKGLSGNQKLSVTIPVNLFAVIDKSNALQYLWAREKLMRLSDYASIDNEAKYKDEITQIGLKYNLMTKYTSFVAIDEENRRISEEIVSVKQPLPLPEDVSEFALGSSVPTFAPTMQRMGLNRATYKLAKDFGGFSEEIGFEQSESESYDELPSYDENELRALIKYPEFAKIAGLEGRVVVKAHIDTDGHLKKYEIEYSDYDIFNYAAIEALKKLTFNPAIKDGNPIEAVVYVKILFKLDTATKSKKVLTKNHNGIDFVDIELGKGKPVYTGDKIRLHYIAFVDDIPEKLYSSYDSNQPLEFTLGSTEVIRGLNEGIEGMRFGGKRLIVVPFQKRLIGKPQFDLKRDKHLILVIEVLK